jgi:hypothetical protein
MSCVIKRVLQFSMPVVYGPIEFFNSSNENIASKCQYSWSADSVCWTSWVDYDNYIRLASNMETDFFLRILFSDTLNKLTINGMQTTCYSVSLYNNNPFIEDLCSESVFNPYANLDCALQLQQQLSDSVICMLGIPIYYFRVKPDPETADYTFKEYVLHNVDSVKQLKLMIPDGTMPSSKPQFSDLDFDWETDWDVELSKTAFARAFGDTEFPKQRDFLYIPMMNRFWEVNSAYDEKNEGLMWHSTTWKLGLIKWNEKTNINQGNFDEFIDNLVVHTYDNVFAELETNEQERTTAVAQVEKPTYAANNIDNIFMQDNIRKTMTKSQVSIISKQYNHKSAIIAKNIYHFAKDGNITYQKGYCGDSGTLSFIIDTKELAIEEYNKLFSFGYIDILINKENIKFGNAITSISKQNKQGMIYTEYLVIARWNRKTFTQEINAYPYCKPENIPAYKLRPEMYYFDFSAIDDGNVCEYSLDNISKKPSEIILSASNLYITNIKFFNNYLSNEEAIKESMKYTTTDTRCYINDLARPLDTGMGYSVK